MIMHMHNFLWDSLHPAIEQFWMWLKSKDNGYHFHVHAEADYDLVEMKGKVEIKMKPLLVSLSKPKFQMRFYQLKTNKCPRIQIYFDLLKLI